jgi:hypothetical protein
MMPNKESVERVAPGSRRRQIRELRAAAITHLLRYTLHMAKRVTTVLAIVAVMVSCSRGVSRIQTRPLPSPNPTSYLFPVPLEEVHAKALEAFSIDHQFDHPVFPRRHGLEPVLDAECATNAAFGKAVFQDPANGLDIYLHSFSRPFATSAVYYGRDGGLPFIAAFHLHLTMMGSGTLVAVTPYETKVINGTRFGIGHSGPGQGNNYESVKPTTVEEYSILQYLGRYLGVTNMPALILPR